MDFDEQDVGPGSHRRSRHGSDFVANAGSMRRIRGHRQMRKLVDDGNRANVECVAGVGLESTNAALTQNYIVVSARHDVLGGKQQLFDGGGDAALQQCRLLHFAQFAQQIEILHVAGAYLEDVDVGEHYRNLRNLHDFADYQQFELITG